MVESPIHAEAVKKSRRGVMTALVLLLVVIGGLAAAYAFLGGDVLVADLLKGDAPRTIVKPSKPTTGSLDTSKTPESSTDATTTTPGSTGSGTSGGNGGTTPVAKPPTGDQAARMYWEQVASQEQIGRLVRGEISKLTIGTVTKSGSTASVRITVTYKAGGSLSGTMILRDYGGVWYFSAIARDGNSLAVRTGKPGDTGVISTIVSQQAANQSIPLGILNGGYKLLTVENTSMGSGTTKIGISLSGGTSARTSADITCVSKVINGEKHWFIASFAKR
jgi:hypothetical protein